MSINLVLISSDLNKQLEIGMVEFEYLMKLKFIEDEKVVLLRYISPYERTFFNKKQTRMLKAEIETLKKLYDLDNAQLNIIYQAVEIMFSEHGYDFLVFVGD